jgi:hypothetical protein
MFPPNLRNFPFGNRQRQQPAHQSLGHHANGDPVVPISKDKLKRWHEKMESLDALRVTIENLPVSRREKEVLRAYTGQMRSITEYVKFEMREKMDSKKVAGWWF